MFLTLNVDFIAMLFLVLYVGAIVVLFLFVVMMLNVRILELNERIISYVPIAISIVLIFFLLISSIIMNNFFDEKSSNLISVFENVTPNILNDNHSTYSFFNNLKTYSNLELISSLLYSDYVYIFLLAGIALLVAMLGSIVLTLNNSSKSKRQDYYIQTNKNIIKAIRHLK
jgi:NADH:ubiquinone oxidoreductase subunit 6 (subunit J)